MRSRPKAYEVAGFVTDTVEHVIASNRLFARQIAHLAAGADTRPTTLYTDFEIGYLFDRAAEPPGIAAPEGKFTGHELLEALAGSRAALREAGEVSSGDMRLKSAPHPVFGELDGVQWALFAAAHTERHRAEILREFSTVRGGDDAKRSK